MEKEGLAFSLQQQGRQIYVVSAERPSDKTSADDAPAGEDESPVL